MCDRHAAVPSGQVDAKILLDDRGEVGWGMGARPLEHGFQPDTPFGGYGGSVGKRHLERNARTAAKTRSRSSEAKLGHHGSKASRGKTPSASRAHNIRCT